MYYILLSLNEHRGASPSSIPLQPRAEFVQMIQMVQGGGATNLWYFCFMSDVSGKCKGCEAVRIGWLDVPSQPELKGEWKVSVFGISLEDSDTPMPMPGA